MPTQAPFITESRMSGTLASAITDMVLQKPQELTEFLRLFLDPERESDFFAFLYQRLTEARWDSVKEESVMPVVLMCWPTSADALVAAVDEEVGASQDVHVVRQNEMGGIFRAESFGTPRANRILFLRTLSTVTLDFKAQTRALMVRVILKEE